MYDREVPFELRQHNIDGHQASPHPRRLVVRDAHPHRRMHVQRTAIDMPALVRTVSLRIFQRHVEHMSIMSCTCVAARGEIAARPPPPLPPNAAPSPLGPRCLPCFDDVRAQT